MHHTAQGLLEGLQKSLHILHAWGAPYSGFHSSVASHERAHNAWVGYVHGVHERSDVAGILGSMLKTR
jgi:hypothetical protein